MAWARSSLPALFSSRLCLYVDRVLKSAMRFVRTWLRVRIEAPRTIIELPEVQHATLLPKRFALAMERDYRTWHLAWTDDPTDFLSKG